MTARAPRVAGEGGESESRERERERRVCVGLLCSARQWLAFVVGAVACRVGEGHATALATHPIQPYPPWAPPASQRQP